MDNDSLDFLELDDDKLQSIRLVLEMSLPKMVGGDKTMDFQGDGDTNTAASIGSSTSKVSFTKKSCFPDNDTTIQTTSVEPPPLQPNSSIQ